MQNVRRVMEAVPFCAQLLGIALYFLYNLVYDKKQ